MEVIKILNFLNELDDKKLKDLEGIVKDQICVFDEKIQSLKFVDIKFEEEFINAYGSKDYIIKPRFCKWEWIVNSLNPDAEITVQNTFVIKNIPEFKDQKVYKFGSVIISDVDLSANSNFKSLGNKRFSYSDKVEIKFILSDLKFILLKIDSDSKYNAHSTFLTGKIFKLVDDNKYKLNYLKDIKEAKRLNIPCEIEITSKELMKNNKDYDLVKIACPDISLSITPFKNSNFVIRKTDKTYFYTTKNARNILYNADAYNFHNSSIIVYKEEGYTCSCCGKHVTPNDSFINFKGKVVCSHCFETKYTKCTSCRQIHLKSSSKEIQGKFYCNKCYNDRVGSCSSCGAEIIKMDNNSDGEGHYFCPTCLEIHMKYKMRNYSFKPDPIKYKIKGESNPNKYFGIELEVNMIAPTRNNKDFKNVIDLFNKDNDGLFYAKRDGSLNSTYGVELVSHPMSYKFAVNKFHDLRAMSSLLNVDSQCGIHIHVGREAILNKMHLSKLLMFFGKNHKFIEFIAQRTSNSYCGKENPKLLKQKIDNPQSSERHSAINLKNVNTIEFRIFKSSVEVDTIIKNIQFVDSIIEYCKTEKINKLTDKNYIDYCSSRDYKQLNLFLTKYNENACV